MLKITLTDCIIFGIGIIIRLLHVLGLYLEKNILDLCIFHKPYPPVIEVLFKTTCIILIN